MFYRIENIPDEQTMQAVVANLLPLVPCARHDKALRYKHLHGQYTCLRTWQLLHSLLLEHAWLPDGFPLANLTYTEDAHGKPRLTVSNLTSVFFSISHTKNALAVAVDNRPIGIDVEMIVPDRRIDQSFLDHTMSPTEQVKIKASSHPCLVFTELWTRKEALFKALGTGIDMAALPTVLENPLALGEPASTIDADDPYSLFTGHTDAYAYSIAQLSLKQ